MRLAADPDAAAWLEAFDGRPEEFEWDDGNRRKNRKHGVEPGDVESLFLGPILFAGRILAPSHPEPRWLLLGKSGPGRNLALIFTRRGRRLRPICCRAMRREERRLYEIAISSPEA